MGQNDKRAGGSAGTKPHRRTGGPEGNARSGNDSPSSMRFVLVFLALAIVGIVGFSIWRQADEQGRVEQQEAATESHRVEPPRDQKVERIIEGLSLEQKVAQLFVVSPESVVDVELAVAAGSTTREALTTYPVGGIVYQSANLQSPDQAKEMLRSSKNYVKDACGIPLLTCICEEGGEVSPVAHNDAFDAPLVDDASTLGSVGDEERARDASRAIAQYLGELGFNTNLAPVAIVASEAGETRSFGKDAESVGRLASAQVDEYKRARMLCCPKSFPGVDGLDTSDAGAQTSALSSDELLSGPAAPFSAAIGKGAPLVMVGSTCCAGLGEGSQKVPACMSSDVIEGLLKDRVGFGGIVITCPMDNKSVSRACDSKDQAVKAIEAGADMVLLPSDFKVAYKGLLSAVKQGKISEDRIDDSLRRIIGTKREYGLQ